MSTLIPILPLPAEQGPVEAPGHFDAPQPPAREGLVLTAETGDTPRGKDSPLLKGLGLLRDLRIGGVPRLWANTAWTREFYLHLQRLTRGLPPPRMLLLSPPFILDCSSLDHFLALYRPFEAELTRRKPQTGPVVQNRSRGPMEGGETGLRMARDLVGLWRLIERHGLRLRLCLDLAELMDAHGCDSGESLEAVLDPLRHCASGIVAVRPLPAGADLSREAARALYFLFSDGRHRLLLPPADGDTLTAAARLQVAGFRLVG